MRAFLVPGMVLFVTGCETLTPFDQPPLPLPPVEDCSAYDWQGTTYDCDVLDRCTEQDFSYRLACCDCDPALCNPDPNCPDDPEDDVPPPPVGQAESCMVCHNGSQQNDYAGPGMGNPHPFGPATYITCTQCHGGNPEGLGRQDSHVAPPPQIGDELNLAQNQESYFNYLTRTGLDKYGPYTGGPNNREYTALDYIQFMNPGDFRVVTEGRGCGNSGCHDQEHAQWAPVTPLGSDRFFAMTMYSIGVPNPTLPEGDLDRWDYTSAGYAWRRQEDPAYVYTPQNFATPNNEIGRVGTLYEIPTGIANYGEAGQLRLSQLAAAELDNDIIAVQQNLGQRTLYPNQTLPGSDLVDLISEAIVGNCADCHAYSSGANNRYADFRSSGCTACHMEYSFDGRSRSTDPNVNKLEPADPDAIAAPERPHIMAHQIRNVAKVLPNGTFVRGQSDKVCVGCHQGSNRTVLQYWGIRLDQNQDLVNEVQYPANPVNFTTTANDTRLFDPAVNNNTFNGRNANQYILTEDYDGDNRDDTPPDVHYEAGLGCIDCHGSQDLHGATEGSPTIGRIMSHQPEVVGTTCKSCHGDDQYYAYTTDCTDYLGNPAQCVTDRFGNPKRNVTVDGQGDYWLRSRVDGLLHYVPQTKDTIYNNNKVNPLTSQLLFSPNASYAMGRVDGNAQTGIGPQQQNILVQQGFSHMDNVSCEACHASWTNTCIGCHMTGIFDANANNYFFNNVDGERVAFTFAADFTYINPILFNLGISARNEVASSQAGMKMFFKYIVFAGDTSNVYAFTDLNGNGNNPNLGGRGAFPSLSHNRIFPHSTRGRITDTYEGVRQCVACHINEDMVNDAANFAAYTAFHADYFAASQNADANFYANLDYDQLQADIGLNTGNQNNSPYFVHMAAGLGTGLFQFDDTGCPNNPLDPEANRQYCPNGAPADNFDANNTVYDLDRIVENTGVANSSFTHPLIYDESGETNRRGARSQYLSGTLGTDLLEKLADPDPNVGLHLDSWLDADGNAQGNAADFLNQ